MGSRWAFGGVFVLGLVAVVGPMVAPHDPLASDVARALQPPSGAHPFGTDALGRDILARVLAAARLDLGMALVAVGLAAPLGTVVGAAAGLWGDGASRLALRGADVLTALPIYLMAMVLVLALGGGIGVVILATALVNLPFYIRLARLQAVALRTAPVAMGARLAGMGQAAVLRHVVLPTVAPLMVVQASVNLGWAMLNAAGLSFLGLGVHPPMPEWGIMVAEGAAHLTGGAWWVAGFPALALVGAVLVLAQAGDALRDTLAVPGRA